MARKLNVQFPKVSVTITDTATLEYGANQTEVDVAGQSVADAFRDASEELGMDSGRQVTFRANGEIVAGNSKLKAGVGYVGQPSHEAKGTI